MNKLLFQILIPTHRRTDQLLPLLDSIVALSHPELLHSVWVVENGSTVARELTESYADRLPIYYRHLAEGNKSKALNLVLPELEPELPTLNLDDDVLVPAGILATYAQAIEQFGRGYYYGGPTTVRYELTPDPSLVKWMPTSNRGFTMDHTSPAPVGRQSFIGFNWVCFPEDALSVGGYDANYGPGAKAGARGQETDMQSRLAEAGVEAVYVPGDAVSHWVPAKYVSEEWVLDRIERTAMQRGKLEGNLLKQAYWRFKMYWCEWKGGSHKYLAKVYKGLLAGSSYR